MTHWVRDNCRPNGVVLYSSTNTYIYSDIYIYICVYIYACIYMHIHIELVTFQSLIGSVTAAAQTEWYYIAVQIHTYI